MADTKYLIVVYSPYDGYLPKRMTELDKFKLSNIQTVVCFPSDYQTKLTGLQTDVVQLIELQPNNNVSESDARPWWDNLQNVREICRSFKSLNM